MKHIRLKIKQPQKRGHRFGALCKAELQPVDELVEAALASDCDDCRTAAGVALVKDKAWSGEVYGVRPEPQWEPQPMENADEICASARKNRDGS